MTRCFKCAPAKPPPVCFEGSQLSATCNENPAFGLDLYARLLDLVAGRVKATESRLAQLSGTALIPSQRDLSRWRRRQIATANVVQGGISESRFTPSRLCYRP